MDTSEANIPTPTKVILNDVKDITGGEDFTLVLFTNGSIASVGNNNFGQLGLGTNQNTSTLTLLPYDMSVQKITSGTFHSFAWNSTHLFAFGANEKKQLGLNDAVARSSPTIIDGVADIVQVSTYSQHSLLLTSAGTVLSFGSNEVSFFFIFNFSLDNLDKEIKMNVQHQQLSLLF